MALVIVHIAVMSAFVGKRIRGMGSEFAHLDPVLNPKNVSVSSLGVDDRKFGSILKEGNGIIVRNLFRLDGLVIGSQTRTRRYKFDWLIWCDIARRIVDMWEVVYKSNRVPTLFSVSDQTYYYVNLVVLGSRFANIRNCNRNRERLLFNMLKIPKTDVEPCPLILPHLTLDSLSAILSRFSLLLSDKNLPLRCNSSFCGVSSGLSRGYIQEVGLVGHLVPLPPEHYSGQEDSRECGSNEHGIDSRPDQHLVVDSIHIASFLIVSWIVGWCAIDILLESGCLGRGFERLLHNLRGRRLSSRERFLIGALGFIGAIVLTVQALTIVLQKYLTPSHLCNTVIVMANVLNKDKQIAVVGALAEGSSIRSIERITGIHRDTIMRLGVRVGQNCQLLLDYKMQDLGCQYLQFDEVWGFIGKKERHVSIDDDPEMGDVWTYCAIDPETKLVPAFKCGKRTLATTTEFVQDVASRMRNRVQISTDALRGYVEAIEQSFGADVDYGQIVKVYTHDAAQHPERKYSAPTFASALRRPICGNPDIEMVSTSHIERLNATTRLHVKRLSRLTLAFSKKLENFKAAVALHFAYYNLVRRHATLRCTPAMAAGVEKDFWSVADLVEATS